MNYEQDPKKVKLFTNLEKQGKGPYINRVIRFSWLRLTWKMFEILNKSRDYYEMAGIPKAIKSSEITSLLRDVGIFSSYSCIDYIEIIQAMDESYIKFVKEEKKHTEGLKKEDGNSPIDS